MCSNVTTKLKKKGMKNKEGKGMGKKKGKGKGKRKEKNLCQIKPE